MSDKNISVADLLIEHMDFLSIQCQCTTGEKRKAYIEQMENLQCLMNRLGVDADKDNPLNSLIENSVFLRLSYDSKVLILNHTMQVVELKCAINNLIDMLEKGKDEKQIERLKKHAGWKMFKLLARLPWGC